MNDARGTAGDFIRKWIFHILAVCLGIFALFTRQEYDWYMAIAIFLVTLLWIARNVIYRDGG